MTTFANFHFPNPLLPKTAQGFFIGRWSLSILRHSGQLRVRRHRDHLHGDRRRVRGMGAVAEDARALALVAKINKDIEDIYSQFSLLLKDHVSQQQQDRVTRRAPSG